MLKYEYETQTCPSSAKLMNYVSLFTKTVQCFCRPSESVAGVYLRYAAPYGCKLGEEEILRNFRRWASAPYTSITGKLY